MAARVNMSEIRAMALGEPYDGRVLLADLRDLCDTVCHKHFRKYVGDDELYDLAICKVTHLLCKGSVDFKYPMSKCFTFLYTTVRNVIGNWIKARDREVSVTEVHSVSPSIRDEDVAQLRFAVKKASNAIVLRMDELNISREGYDGLIWGASFYRAVFQR